MIKMKVKQMMTVAKTNYKMTVLLLLTVFLSPYVPELGTENKSGFFGMLYFRNLFCLTRQPEDQLRFENYVVSFAAFDFLKSLEEMAQKQMYKKTSNPRNFGFLQSVITKTHTGYFILYRATALLMTLLLFVLIRNHIKWCQKQDGKK